MQQSDNPDNPAPKRRGRGRPTSPPTSMMIRIPNVLKPAVVELVAQYRIAKRKAWEAAPLRFDAGDEKDQEPQP